MVVNGCTLLWLALPFEKFPSFECFPPRLECTVFAPSGNIDVDLINVWVMVAVVFSKGW